MSHSQIDIIVSLCQQIKAQGSTPSTGLIRAKLSNPLPLPVIIKGLQHWKANPEQEIASPAAKAQTHEQALNDDELANITRSELSSLYSRIEQLETDFKALQTEVQALRQK